MLQVGDDARRRHFTVEQVATMLAQEEEYRGLADFMFELDDDEAPGTATARDLPDDDITDDDASRFAREIAAANRGDPDALPPVPRVVLGEANPSLSLSLSLSRTQTRTLSLSLSLSRS